MRVLGKSYDRDSEIVELDGREFDAIKGLIGAFLRGRYPPAEDHWDEGAVQAFDVIRTIARAIGEASKLEETIRAVVEKGKLP